MQTTQNGDCGGVPALECSTRDPRSWMSRAPLATKSEVFKVKRLWQCKPEKRNILISF